MSDLDHISCYTWKMEKAHVRLETFREGYHYMSEVSVPVQYSLPYLEAETSFELHMMIISYLYPMKVTTVDE